MCMSPLLKPKPDHDRRLEIPSGYAKNPGLRCSAVARPRILCETLSFATIIDLDEMEQSVIDGL
jgi:hypothetical protein